MSIKGGSWIQIDGKLIPKSEFHGNNVRQRAGNIIDEIEPFTSPIDKSVIHTRAQRDAHMKAHGVTNSSDFSKEFLDKKGKERHMKSCGLDPASKADRIRILKAATER